ncbi:MAG: tetratricopeptide repeat protein [Myxococcales bacterium]|nr:tetratricopeptide repeat protein [Myxococcales bacterium]
MLSETKSDPRAHASHDLERNVAFEAIRAQLFAGPLQPVEIGRFQIAERIGQGGMGVVYSAVDPQLRRKVAIKVVRDLGGDEDEIDRARRSLEREARAAAGVRHPNVVTVYDSGGYGDAFYVAMELVEGHTLRQWLRLRRRHWTEITSMFVGAGRGLHAAHAAGLVHCDFKPDNVLIGPDGRPQVSDFGLVRWTEARTELEPESLLSSTIETDSTTLHSVIAGTPRYMAPEQRLGLPVSPRSDQFAYCVALYDALFGAPPYRREDGLPFEEPGVLGRAHARSDLPRPIVRALLVGLSLAPPQRHDSMAVLVDRLEHAMARRRRRKWWAVGALAAVSAGVVGYAVADDPLDPCEGAERALDETWSDETREAVRRPLLTTGTEARASRVTALLDQYAHDWSAMRRASCEATHHEGGQSAELFELRTVCLDRRRNALHGLVERLRAHDGAILRQAVSIAEALPPIAECEAEHIRTHQLVDAGATHNEKTRSLESWIEASRANERIDQAELRAAQGDHAAAIEQLRQVEQQAHDAGLLYVEAAAIDFRVGHELSVGTGEGAIAELQRALALAIESRDFTLAAHAVSLMLYARRIGAPEPVDAALLLALGRACARNSVEPAVRGAMLDIEESELLAAAGRMDDALQRLEAGEQALRAEGRAEHGMMWRLGSQRGKLLLDFDRPKDAIAVLEQTLDRQRALLGPDDPMVGDTVANLGHARRLAGDLEGARRSYQEAQRIYTASLGPRTLRSALVTSGLASVLQEQGELAAAREAFETSIAIEQELYGPTHVSLAPSLDQLAELEYEQEAYEPGLAHARRALEIIDASLGEDHPYSAAFKITVGKLELALGQTEAAVGTLGKAHEALVANAQLSPMWRGEAAFFLARAILQSDPARRAEADSLSRGALAELARAQGEGSGALAAEIDAWRAAQGLEGIATGGADAGG